MVTTNGGNRRDTDQKCAGCTVLAIFDSDALADHVLLTHFSAKYKLKPANKQ